MQFKDFKTLNFPESISAVYLIFFIKNDKKIPFYVGETGRFQGRVGDYVSAHFKASTDFRVGETIRYLQEKGCKVIIKYKSSQDRKREQDEIIKYFQSLGHRLLNDLSGYNYKTANEDEEREKIKRFCDDILAV